MHLQKLYHVIVINNTTDETAVIIITKVRLGVKYEVRNINVKKALFSVSFS